MFLNGITIYNGYSFGKAFIYKEKNIIINDNLIKSDKIDYEINVFLKAYKKTIKQFKKIKLLCKGNKDKKLLFDGYILILSDKSLLEKIITLIKNKLYYAEYAVTKVISDQINLFKNVNNIYIRERANDLLDIRKRLIYNIKNIDLIDFNFLKLNYKIIIVAKDLSPSQIIQFNLDFINGYILEKGSITSHSSIISRSREIVSILGIKDIMKKVVNNDNLIIDGIKDRVYINTTNDIHKKLKTKYKSYLEKKKSLLKLKELPAVTYDGYRIKLFANIGNNNDIYNIFKYGAEGIGLYRTEFLFMDRNDFPNEEEQFNTYKQVVKFMKNKSVTIRTIDLGGDKFLSYMNFPKENSPFLGWRSIRIYKDKPEIIYTQLRAIIRASSYGRVRILFPLIISLEEVFFLKNIIEDVKTDLTNKNIKFNSKIKIGCMIETPSAAIISGHLANELDFFSIGTNDLTQFILAVDRNNVEVSNLYNPLYPSVLNLIKYIIDSIHEKNKKVCLCGELAGDLKCIRLLLGLGLDELSMNVSMIPSIKKIIRSSYITSSRRLSEKILDQKLIKDIQLILEKNNV